MVVLIYESEVQEEEEEREYCPRRR
jgi:hypothetical protein